MIKQSRSKSASSGFAAIEALLLVVILAAVIGVGAYVLQQKKTVTKTLAAPTVSSATPQASTSGAASSVEQLTQQETQTEAGYDNSADSQAQQADTSTVSAANNVGGAYNENSL